MEQNHGFSAERPDPEKLDNIIVLSEGDQKCSHDRSMLDLSLNASEFFNPFSLDKFMFNDQGTSNWYKNKYPGFPDNYYQLLELYSLGGVRSKQFKSHLKKLKKKGKFHANDESILEQFQKTSISE